MPTTAHRNRVRVRAALRTVLVHTVVQHKPVPENLPGAMAAQPSALVLVPDVRRGVRAVLAPNTLLVTRSFI